MRKVLILALIAVLAGATGMMAQKSDPQILDSGFAPGDGPSGTGTLYSQMDACGGGSPASQQFPDFGDSRLQAADDFVVPAGTSWTLEGIMNQGTFFNGPGPFTSVIFEVYDDSGPGGLPGALVCAESGLSSAGGVADPNLDLTLDGTCVLTEGTYWLSLMPEMPFVPNGQYAWTVNDSTNGSEFAWQDPDGLTGNPCNTWGLGITTCGIGAAFPDLCFAIDGTEGGVPTAPWPAYAIFLVLLAFIGLTVLRRAF